VDTPKPSKFAPVTTTGTLQCPRCKEFFAYRCTVMPVVRIMGGKKAVERQQETFLNEGRARLQEECPHHGASRQGVA
jgi:hypothetical protein